VKARVDQQVPKTQVQKQIAEEKEDVELAKLKLEKNRVKLEKMKVKADLDTQDSVSAKSKIEVEYKLKEAEQKLASAQSHDGKHDNAFRFSWYEEKFILRSLKIPFFLFLALFVFIYMNWREMTLFIVADFVCLALWWELRKKKIAFHHTYDVQEPYLKDHNDDPDVQSELARQTPYKYAARLAKVEYEVQCDSPFYAWMAGINLNKQTLHVSRTLMRHAQSAFTQNYDDDYDTISGRMLRAMQRLPINVPAGAFDDGNAIYRDSHTVVLEWVKYRIQSEKTPNYGPVACRTI